MLKRELRCRDAPSRARDAAAHHQAAAELSTRLAQRGVGITPAVRHAAEARQTGTHSVHAEKLTLAVCACVMRNKLLQY